MGRSIMLEDNDDDLMDGDDDDIEENHLNTPKTTSSDKSRKRIEDYLEELSLKRQIEDMFFDDDF